jgi:hypothetical protein
MQRESLLLCRCHEADEGSPQSSLTLLRLDFAIEGDYQMDQTTFTLSANTLHCALELSKNSWLLAIQFRDVTLTGTEPTDLDKFARI